MHTQKSQPVVLLTTLHMAVDKMVTYTHTLKAFSPITLNKERKTENSNCSAKHLK